MNARIASRLKEAHPEVAESLRLAHEKAIRDRSPLTVTHLAHELLKASSVKRCLGEAAQESLPTLSQPIDGVAGQVAFDLSDLLKRASDCASEWKLEQPDATCILAEALAAPELASAGLRPEALPPGKQVTRSHPSAWPRPNRRDVAWAIVPSTACWTSTARCSQHFSPAVHRCYFRSQALARHTL